VKAMTRRGFLVGTGLTSLAAAATSAAARLRSAATAATPALRPEARGGSSVLCARCGSQEHAMLDPRCPGGDAAAAARQVAARSRAGGREAPT
jgi:hypothetical protein